MKIAAITYMMAPYRVALFNELAKNPDFDLTAVYTAKNEDNRDWILPESEIRHKYRILRSIVLPKRWTCNSTTYLHIPFNMISTLNKINPDVVIPQEYNPAALIALLWAKLKRRKFISWSDGTLNSERAMNALNLLIRKLICRNSDAFIASSSMTKRTQITYGAKSEKVFICHLTVDIEKYLVEKTSYKTANIIYVGRLVELKGLDLLFKALSRVRGNFILHIVGNGPERESLEKLASDLKIRNKVIFHGFKQQDEIREYYKNSDIFVLPTRNDCFGLVVTEAMCAALPVIVSKYADAAYDLVSEGENGFIVDPFDVDSMAEKIEMLLGSEDLRNRMGQASRRQVERFRLENVAKPYFVAVKYALGK